MSDHALPRDAPAQSVAERVANALYARDAAAQANGIALLEVGPGHSRMRMTVQPSMLNAHQVCHGGHIFTLADTAFAYACNSYDDMTLALQCDISFLKPGRVGSVLTATASERKRGRRTGLYDVDVHDDQGDLVATFRGTSFSLGKPALGDA